MGEPDNGDCQLTIAWHIQKGQYGQTRLDGLNAVGVFHTPGNMFTGPKWKAAIYLDEPIQNRLMRSARSSLVKLVDFWRRSVV